MSDLFTMSGATISDCGLYRYHLWRVWDDLLPAMCFVMQNPSKADAVDDDPTIRKCISFARRDGFGSISVRNVFALRATDERELLTHSDPVGPLNGEHLQACRNVSLLTRLVVSWGNRVENKRLRTAYQNASAICLMQKPYCLGTNKNGEPKHPLFLKASTLIIPWRGIP
jgi:hypothetical protein